MTEPKLISPLLDNYIMGSPISEHHGVRCCPAIENGTDERYIVKIISVPASSTQLDALLLTGAYPDKSTALEYFREIKDGILQEVNTLEKLAELEGFLAYTGCQVEPMDSGEGFDIYLKSSYKRSLQKHFTRHSFTHLDALNLGLDLCAALGVSRRCGYLYVDLKPSNIFVTDQRLFRIGDLGFVPLSSLKYASLPEKYLSVYTPPEVRDAFSSLNTTMDVYAAGLILYQTYNNGELPFNDTVTPGEELPAPLYADYEMSEIILKACAPNPEDRWQDPMEMGQAIISYMQRNGALDTPIVPMPIEESKDDEPPAFETEDADETIEEIEITESIDDSAEEIPDEDTPSSQEDELPSIDDEAEFLTLGEDEEEPELLVDEYDVEITDEVSEILEQADELVSLDVPEPVIVPDHVDLPEPEAPIAEEEPEEEPAETEVSEETTEDAEPADDPQEIPVSDDSESEDDSLFSPEIEKKKRHWVRNSILIVALLALLAGGIFFYTQYYLLPIEFIAVEGNEDTLTVLVTTEIDESLLQVICSDTYGNQIPAPVINGKAEFTGLIPNTAYSIKVVANGFHRLTGNSSTAYSTPVQTKIVQFDAVAGTTEDSVILRFTPEGPDCKEWTVLYTADGEQERSATFTSHSVTLTGLTVGKEYAFRLVPCDDLYVTGQNELLFTTRKLVKAENVEIVSCMNNALTAQWTAPAGESVTSWSVHCYNDTYNQTLITTSNSVTFQDIDHTAEYTVEVKAVGMSVGQTATVSANSITAANFRVENTDPAKLVFTWEPSQTITEDGWILRYSVVGIESETTVSCKENSISIYPVIPNATYRVQLEDIKGNVLLGSKISIPTAAPVDFSKEFKNFTATREDLEFAMCKTPVHPNWGRYDVAADDYTSDFAIGQSASFLVKFSRLYNAPAEDVSIQYVIRNQDGTPVYSAQQIRTWKDMWPTSYCKMNVPSMPATAGTYTIEIYFNGGLAHSQNFTVQ